ncbi:hypothetical protein [Wenzhouxiangella sp. EGI_FJ10305]|uniref:hypothetical protein n=1 Tax=Wenzhouxiangella sp. EGI_FJ10305 TaxID=3243768 RepID=UPI0035D9EA3F
MRSQTAIVASHGAKFIRQLAGTRNKISKTQRREAAKIAKFKKTGRALASQAVLPYSEGFAQSLFATSTAMRGIRGTGPSTGTLSIHFSFFILFFFLCVLCCFAALRSKGFEFPGSARLTRQ